MAPSRPPRAAGEGAVVAVLVVGVEGAVRVALPPPEESLLGQAVAAGFLAAVVVEEVPGAAMVGEPAVVVTERSGTVVTEEE